MEVLVFLVGVLVGVVIMVFISGSLLDNSHYNGGHAAGRVHHKRSWEE